MVHNDAVIRYTFTAHERLKSKKLINQLFSQGKAVNFYPIRLIYLPCSSQVAKSSQVLFAASKRKFRGAVARNTIKRRMREAHRLHKHLLTTRKSSSFRLLIGYIYMGSGQQSNFQAIREKVIEAIDYLKNLHEKELLS